MTPVIIGNAELWHGCCEDVFPLIGKVDACIMDPPYGIGFAAQPTRAQRANGKKPEDWDDQAVIGIDALRAIGEIQIIWGGNYYALPPTRGWLSWFKPDAPPSMANFELAWTNQDRNARQLSVSISATNAERVGHPTQKPLSLMRWTIDQAGSEDRVQTIADWYMGSGTTGVAAMQLGRKFVGVERDARYFDIACKRIEQAVAQGTLFAPEPMKQVQEALI